MTMTPELGAGTTPPEATAAGDRARVDGASTRSLLPVVVESGCCIGCGACAVAAPETLTMAATRYGTYEPVRRDGRPLGADPDSLPASVDAVCGFSPGAANEDEIGLEQFGPGDRHEAVGRFEAIWAGHVSDDGFRRRGSSGGVTSWLLLEALRSGVVDAVIHVSSDRTTIDGASTYSSYTVSTTEDELVGGRGSRYHVQDLEHVMSHVRDHPGRYAVVGVPCFIKAVRLLGRNDPVIAERTALTVGLVCGHLKSARFSDYLGWSVGIEPGQLADVDYRHKVEGRPANRYAIAATSVAGEEIAEGVEHIAMSDWGIGLFKPSACDYCDDVVAETADVTCGDAWLPPLMSDWRGANVVIARSSLATSLLDVGRDDGRLTLEPWTADQAAASQEAGLRHRRAGLAVRLAQRERTGTYAPPKRVAPAPDELATPFGRRMLLREQISATSHLAFAEALEAGSLTVFHRRMKPLVNRYYGSRSRTLARRTASWVLYRIPVPVEKALRRLTAGRRFA
jgi:coenzyme F420 hydrogenase subunit beta